MVKSRQKPRSVAEQIEGMSESALACRDIRHAWAVDTPYHRVEVEGGVRSALYVERAIGCMRCGTARVELYRVFKHRLELLRAHYEYPQGYLMHGVGGAREIRGRIRREGVRRVLEALDEDDNLSQDEED